METVMMVILMMLGIQVTIFGAILLHHSLKGKEQAEMMDQITTKMYPELEQMTSRMIERTVDSTCNKMVEMTKELNKIQYE